MKCKGKVLKVQGENRRKSDMRRKIAEKYNPMKCVPAWQLSKDRKSISAQFNTYLYLIFKTNGFQPVQRLLKKLKKVTFNISF